MVKIRLSHVQLCQPTRFPDTKLDHFQYFLIRLSCLAIHHCNKRDLTKNQSVFEEPGNSEESHNTTLLSDFMLNLLSKRWAAVWNNKTRGKLEGRCRFQRLECHISINSVKPNTIRMTAAMSNLLLPSSDRVLVLHGPILILIRSDLSLPVLRGQDHRFALDWSIL